jgi:hypothetical protein
MLLLCFICVKQYFYAARRNLSHFLNGEAFEQQFPRVFADGILAAAPFDYPL